MPQLNSFKMHVYALIAVLSTTVAFSWMNIPGPTPVQDWPPPAALKAQPIGNLEGYTASDIISGLEGKLIDRFSLEFTLKSLVLHRASSDIALSNQFPFPIVIDYLSAKGSLNGTTYVAFEHSFLSGGFPVEAHSIAASGSLGTVKLPQGGYATRQIYHNDLYIEANISLRAAPVNGKGGLPVHFEYAQSSGDLHTQYNITFGRRKENVVRQEKNVRSNQTRFVDHIVEIMLLLVQYT